MEIVRAAVHYVTKTVHSDEVKVTPADTLLEESPQLLTLAREILETYSVRCAQQAGVFQEDEVNYPFAAIFRAYQEVGSDFLTATVTATNRLAILMRRQLLSTGGHLLFVHYRRADENFLLVVKLNSTKGSMFEGLARVADAVHLNVHTLQVAARINLTTWLAGLSDVRYLTFVCKRELGHPSTYFRDFIGCDMMTDSKAESGKLATVVDEFCKQGIANQLLSVDDAVAIMRRVFDYAVGQTKAREPISLQAVAAVVTPDNAEIFMAYLNNHSSRPTDEFIADRGSLRKLADYVFNSKELKITMSHQFKTDHRVRVENNNLIIENPPSELVETLAD